MTVDSSEQAVIKSESGAATTSVQQGLAKGWINYKQAATFVINDSFNISGVNDDGTGLGDTNYTNNFGNANYVASGASGRVNLTGSDAYWTFPCYYSWRPRIMAYIGKSPSQGVRNRFQYQATAGQTSFSGSDANSLTLTYTDSLYLDVYQNGILLVPGDDYTATTGTTVVLVQGASLNDIVEMVAYDVFSVNETYTKTESDNRYPFKGNNSIIRLNGQTISADITIDSDENGVSGGPITQSATVTVNGYWSIV